MSTEVAATVPVVDASRKFHRVKVHGEIFEVDERYTNLQYIASGAYGFVVAAEDTVMGRKVAIKKVKQVFRNLTDAKRILRELKLLRHLGGHENLIWLLGASVYPNQRDFQDLYIITDLMESDLGRIIDSSQTLSDSHIKYFLYQILRGLKYLHSAKILHRDLKPQNILVNSSCELVICDFGLARGTAIGDTTDATLDEMGDPTEESGAGVAANLTVYVVTRWYRAPELLMGSSDYGDGVDVWSVGCILAEILGRRPLFRGSNYMHQLQVIVEVLGTPEAEQMATIKRKSAKQAITAMGKRKPVPLSKLYPRANPDALDLLEKMLVFDPAKRISVLDALAHPYLADYHYPEDEPVAPRMVDLEFEKMGKLTKQHLQTLMIREINFFNPSESEEAPVPPEKSRLSETAAKLQVTGEGVVDSTPAVASTSEARAAVHSEGDDASKASGGAASAGAGAGAGAGTAAASSALLDAKIAMSQTAEKDAAFESARREAQRIAQQQRSAAALAALGGKPAGASTAGAGSSGAPPRATHSAASGDSDLDGLAITPDGLDPAVQASIEAQFDRLETVLTQRLTEHVQRLMSPALTRLSTVESLVKGLAAKLDK